MQKKVAVEILGNKAHIESVTGRAADKTWRPEDAIQVWLGFEEAVGSILSFGINLTVREYTRDEFLKAVQQEGEHTLKRMLGEDQLNRALRMGKVQKQNELDKIAWRIKAAIGLV